MRTRTRVLVATLVAVTLLAAGCGDDGTELAIPTADELASSLLDTTDLNGDWTVWVPPDGSGVPATGVVTGAQSDMLPTLALCEQAGADAIAANDDLTWMAFRQIDLAVDDPIEPPDDDAGHMVFVQEFLTSGDPDDIAATFELLRDGMTACLGDIPAGEEGPGTATTMPLPDVGDDRFGQRTIVEEAGGWAEWRLHTALVRTGAVLMSVVIVDIRAGDGVEPFYSDADVGTIVETAVDRV